MPARRTTPPSLARFMAPGPWGAAVVLIAVGCGEITVTLHETEADPSGSAGSGAGSSAGATSGAGATVADGDFRLALEGDITRLDVLSDSVASDRGGSLTPDGLEFYFASNRAGGAGLHDIYRSRRASATAPWEPPERVAAVSSPADDRSPRVTRGGLRLFLTSDRGGTLDIYVTSRIATSEPWGVPTLVPELSTTQRDVAPSVTPSGLHIAFASDRAGGLGDLDLYLSTRPSVGDLWPAPAPLGISSTGVDTDPTLARAGLVAVFSSDRAGNGLELFFTSRSSLNEPFQDPVQIPILGGISHEVDGWLSEDATSLYFASNRDGSFDLYSVPLVVEGAP